MARRFVAVAVAVAAVFIGGGGARADDGGGGGGGAGPVAAPATPPPFTSCEDLRGGCEACRAAGCAWCLATRRCTKDEAWFCMGDADHVGLAGTVRECPSREALAAERARKRAVRAAAAREAAAAAAAEAQAAAAEAAAGAAGCGDEEGSEGEACARPAAAATTPRRRAARGGGHSRGAFSPGDPEHIAVLRARAAKSREASGAGGARGLGGAVLRYGAAHPYETLVIAKDATAREVRRAYLTLSTQLHPDRNLPEHAQVPHPPCAPAAPRRRLTPCAAGRRGRVC